MNGGARRGARRGRTGFTLLETILAITLTAMILGIAGAALRAAADARRTVLGHRETQQADARFRATLQDMLRHAPASSAVDEPLLRIDGAPPALVFLSRGVLQPFGVGRVWRVTVTSGSDGTTMRAEPVAREASETPVTWRLPGTALAAIDVLERASPTGDPQGWRSDWPLAAARPALLRIRFARIDAAGDGAPAREPSALGPFVVELAPVEPRP